MVVNETFAVQLTQAGNKTAGTAFSVTITALNDGATFTGYTGAKALTFSGPGTSLNGTAPTYPSSVTFTNGVGTTSITLTKAETATLTVADGARTGSVTVTVLPIPPSLAWSELQWSSNGTTWTNMVCADGGTVVRANGDHVRGRLSRSLTADGYGNARDGATSYGFGVDGLRATQPTPPESLDFGSGSAQSTTFQVRMPTGSGDGSTVLRARIADYQSISCTIAW